MQVDGHIPVPPTKQTFGMLLSFLVGRALEVVYDEVIKCWVVYAVVFFSPLYCICKVEVKL